MPIAHFAAIALFVATPTSQSKQPPPPPGTERVLSSDQHGKLIAACAEIKAPPIEQGTRRIPATEIWITDGRDVWKTKAVPGACDPAWSPDGSRLALAAPDGIWVLSGPHQEQGERLTDDQQSTAPTEFGSLTFSKPRWSPDGSRVAALASNGGTSWVEVFDLSTGKRVFKSDPEVYEFSWGSNARTLRIGGKEVAIP